MVPFFATEVKLTFLLASTMRIGIDARMYSSSFTGIGRYVHELTKHLFILAPEDEFVLFFNSPEYELFDPPTKNIKKVRVQAKHYSFSEQTTFFRALQKEKLDLMHFTHFNAPLLYYRKSIVTIHDLTLSFFPGKKMKRWWHRFGYYLTIRAAVKKASKVIAVSKHTKKDLMTLLKTPENKICVTYEAPDVNFRPITENKKKEIKKKYQLQKFLLYTGVWREHKNVVGMIEAFSKISQKFPEVSLVITGRPDPTYPEVIETIQKFQLEDRVKRVGLVPEQDLYDLVGAADAYVFPSFYEGFGLPPLEAMASGVPVMASKSSCIPEICGKENALFFDPNNINEISASMEKILTDESVRKKLQHNGFSRVKDFSWKTMAEETLAVYRGAFAK